MYLIAHLYLWKTHKTNQKYKSDIKPTKQTKNEQIKTYKQEG
ncbi:hypothetical protein Pf1_02531 [Flavobacterium columnare]|nr:hypothetical protein Pf1_02531 [Flavobacterium columnare]